MEGKGWRMESGGGGGKDCDGYPSLVLANTKRENITKYMCTYIEMTLKSGSK